MTIGIRGVLPTIVAAWLIAVVPNLSAIARADPVRGVAVAIAPSVFVTNRDLVADCNAISIGTRDRRADARVIATDEINNLALVGADIATDGFAALRRDPEIGEPVAMFSFVPRPRADLPSRLVDRDLPSGTVDVAGHIVPGTIAAITGPGDDRRFLQISARLRAEDSGSPVLDARGNIVGVVDGETDALVAEELADIDLQDIIFAMRVNAIGRLAGAAHIPFSEGNGTGRELTPGALAERAAGFTARLSCDM